MVVFTNDQVGSTVEEVCGEVVHTNFEETGYGPDPMHPSDNECSSVDDDDNSDDDEISELYTNPAAPARGRVRGVERVEVVIEPTPPATAQAHGSMEM